ncbi:MAG: hypothetical protein CFE28_11860 [Alphaproteobacteria bacterium PA2]|nr:MAG: hypothetical protein CFE28_11860 [Alphaproteobacteria bacterium PA2]
MNMLSRRQALISAAGLGLSLNFLARTAEAATSSRRLIFINCRGAMDGLSVAPPVGDPDYPDLRRGLVLTDTALKLDSDFGLHPALTSVYALAQAGQARIAPAIATPDRARSHFEAQDVLESGSSVVYGATTGWLNRAVGALQARGRLNALSIGATAPLVMRGPAEVSSWSPGALVNPQARLPGLLMDLYRNDPLLGPAFARGLETEAMAREAMREDLDMSAVAPADLKAYAKQGQDASRKLGDTLADFMKAPGGPQIAAISLDGFDTHANQAGLIAARLGTLDAVIDGIQKGLGPDWANTVIIVATEFGRTARVNGTGGTDHGTASTAMVLGGGLKRGGVIGDWPTLKSSALFENRDLAPTLDMRALFKGALADQLGLDRQTLDTVVFPDSRSVTPLSGLI